MKVTYVDGGLDAELAYEELLSLRVPAGMHGLTVFQSQVAAAAAAGDIDIEGYKVGVRMDRGEGGGMTVTFEFREEAAGE